METRISQGFKDFLRNAFFVFLAVVLIAGLVAIAPDSAGAKRAVEANGFSNVTIGGANVLLAGLYCSESDTFYFEVLSATNANGQDALKNSKMYVCAGFLKGYTIRNR